MNELAGKTAIITGSGRGIGRGIAMTLAQQGCNIVVNFFRKRTVAEETAERIEQIGQTTGARAIVVKAHVGKEDDVNRLVDTAAQHFGRIDIFVGNAASGVQKSILDIDTRAWDWTLNINARSILLGAQAAVPQMRKQGWGRIVAISSIGGRRVLPEYGVVGVSKSAIETMTRYLAIELAPHNITANCISPGIVLTQALDTFPRKDAMVEHAVANTPVGRLTTPEDVGNLAAFLCSNSAAMLTGQTIELDGGYSLLMTG